MKSPIKKICIALGILIIAGISGSYIFYSMIRSNVEHIYAIEADSQSEFTHEQQQSNLKSIYMDINPDVALLSQRFIDATGTVPFIEYIESLARQAGTSLTVDSVNVAASSNKSIAAENLQLSLSIQGTWHQVYTFIRILESLPYKASIQSLNVSQNIYSQDNQTAKTKSTTQIRVWKGSLVLTVLKRK